MDMTHYTIRAAGQLVKLFRVVSVVFVVLVFSSCARQTTPTKDSGSSAEQSGLGSVNILPGPPAIIYKTKENYFDKVPVLLSEDHTRIIQYPDIRDVKVNGEYTYPERLIHGYLLDNRGINEHIAFLKYTYEEYGNLDSTPSPEELMMNILDPEPLISMFKCGARSNYQNVEEEVNELISTNQFEKFEKLR